MADNSQIEWTDATWNPIRARNKATGAVGWFCIHHSEGCRNCYAEGFNARLGTKVAYKAQLQDQVEIYLDEELLLQPLQWKRPRKIFVGSMTDIAADFVPDEILDRMFAVMALTERHTYQVLTKRPDRLRAYFRGIPEMPNEPAVRGAIIEGEAQAIHHKLTGEDPSLWLAVHMPLPNVWLGTSAEDQASLDKRAPEILAIPAAVHFLSAEPLLEGLRFLGVSADRQRYWNYLTGETGVMQQDGPDFDHGHRFSQVIVGGESGPKARPMHPHWAREILAQCELAPSAFFFKQWGTWAPVLSTDPAWLKSGRAVAMDAIGLPPHDLAADPDSTWFFERLGKRDAGRLLDGVEHNAMPGAPS